MDVDGEEDSQFSAFTSSLSWWMMKSLWKEGMPDEKLRLLVADTFLLKDGHPECWYFTSSKSGRVLKRANKRLDWDGLVKFLVQRARTPSGATGTNLNHSWPPGVIATARRLRDGQTSPMMLTAPDFKSLREKHNADLLDEIVAVQPYVAKTGFMGCGLFETEFQRKGRRCDAQAALSTFELAQWPQEDARRFECFQSAAEVPESCSSSLERRKVDRSAKRVHGVLHRVLAMTTRSIVEHVQRETGEVILRVVAQYAFVPGSGQPTLLWLDSVETGGSTHKQDVNLTLHDYQCNLDANAAFTQLTRELAETSREWSTFFPPKMADIAGGKLAAGSGLGASPSPRSYASSENDSDASSQAEEILSSIAESGLAKGVVPNGSLYNKPNEPTEPNATTMGEVPLSSEQHRPMGVTFASSCHRAPTGFPAAGSVAERNRSLRGRRPEVGYTAMNVGIGGGGGGGGGGAGVCRDNFTLPTESWARRSSRWRGLDISGTGEGGKCSARLSNKEWVRRRSMGTTMRFDDRRPDLRRGSESHRPQTAPLSGGLGEVEGGRAVAKRRGSPTRGGTMSHRLPSKKNGCHGDYCKREGMTPTKDAENSQLVGDRRGLNGRSPSAPPKVVPYRSILRSRAEEKALSLRPKSQIGASKGREMFERSSTPGGGLVGLGLRGSKRKGKACLATLVAERMRLLAANISDEGRGEYFRLRSSDRAKAGVPEAAQRAVEELVYEEALSHLHPTTIGRPVAVCDTCAMVYGQMDLCRKQTKSLKALACGNSREARIAWTRRQRREHQQKQQQLLPDGDHTKNNTEDAVGAGGDEPALLRRYSELNLKTMPAR